MRPAGRARRLLAIRPPKAPRPPKRDEDDDYYDYEQPYSPTIGNVSGVFEGGRKTKPAQPIGFRPPQERNTDA